MKSKSKLSLVLSVLLTVGLLVGGSITASTETITVVSQNYAEPQILVEMVKILVENGTDLDVDHKMNFQGSSLTHQAVIHGDASIYVSYTGTQFSGPLGQTYSSDWNRETIQKYVQDEYAKRWDLKWYTPFGFENTYTLAVRRETAEELNLKNFSDLMPYSKDMIIAVDDTFKERAGDGYYELADTYNFDFKRAVSMNYGLMYRAVRAKDVDVAVAYSTDGRIPGMNLVVLKDDKGFFPPYDACLIIRNDLLEKYPVIDDLVQPLIGNITVEEMQRVNSWVDVDGATVEDAAQRFLKEKGLI